MNTNAKTNHQASPGNTARIGQFFDSIKELEDLLSLEDLDEAIESLKQAELDSRQKRNRTQLEEEAEKKKEERREAAIRRAEARKGKRPLLVPEETTRIDLPADFTTLYDEEDLAAAHATSIPDGLMMSLDALGMVDIGFIAQVTGRYEEEVIETLRGSIYQNPLHWDGDNGKGWETADEYLSGNLMHKYKVAEEANEKYSGHFRDNVAALEKVMGPGLVAEDIYVTLGSPWVPPDIIDDFIAYMALGEVPVPEQERGYYLWLDSNEDALVRRDEYSGEWEVPEKTRFRKGRFYGMFEQVNYETFGTRRMDMLYILENTLNMKTLVIRDPKAPLAPEKNTRIINRKETVKVLEKQRHMIETFQKWVWEDEDRRQRLLAAYNRKYGSFRKRHFDGSFLELPGMAEDIELYDYQKNAVARILFSPNTLLAHDVGAGKTYIMIAAGMELRRLGKSKKNLYVVPNNILGQWETLFRNMYPAAKILTVDISNFSGRKRLETLEQIRDEDYDAILVTYSCFDMLPLSDKYYRAVYKERLEILEKSAQTFTSRRSVDAKRKALTRTLEKLLKSYAKEKNKTGGMCFDDLGINTLFVDEAHNYKNVKLGSRIIGVRGMVNGGSAKSDAMMDKVHCVQRMNDGGRVVFATGTPVTNSLSDLYVVQKYLQEGELEFQGIRSFDAWVGMYAEKVTDFEIDLDTSRYHMVTRFARFRNIPELTATLASIADFHQTDKTDGIPDMDGYEDCVMAGSKGFREYLEKISMRADAIRSRRVSNKEDNMLKLTTDGRRAALDMRLVSEGAKRDPKGKVSTCAGKVFEVYKASRDVKGTQLVFCDISTPKAGFNLYDDLKSLLIRKGIPKEEIAFIHDAETDAERRKLFSKVREGEVAVLIGSTAKMGHGMNVQKHLIAIHHLDVPWRPSDMVQREGRILRQGNENEKVHIYRYITKASFDAYSWQLLEIKQRFISQVISGEAAMRDGTDIDDTVLSYAEVKALAVGDPKIKKRVEVSNELDRYRLLQRGWLDDRREKQRLLTVLPGKMEQQREKIARCAMDMKAYEKEKVDYDSMKYAEQKAIREAIWQAAQANQNSPEAKTVLTYQGFKVVVPAYMVPRVPKRRGKGEDGESVVTAAEPIPYVHLVKNNTYFLELETESGITKRLNYFLEHLEDRKREYEDELRSLENRYDAAKESLEEETVGYEDEIRKLSLELAGLNEELGVL